MNLQGIFIFIVVLSLLCALMRNYSKEYAILLSLSVGILIMLKSFELLADVIDKAKSIAYESGEIYENVKILLKALSIAIITSFASDICIDAGEKALSSRVEFFGKISVMIVSLPILSELYNVVFEILGA